MVILTIMQMHVVNGTEKYIINENFINMHKKYSEKSIKLLKYNLEIQNVTKHPEFRESLVGVKRQKDF